MKSAMCEASVAGGGPITMDDAPACKCKFGNFREKALKDILGTLKTRD